MKKLITLSILSLATLVNAEQLRCTVVMEKNWTTGVVSKYKGYESKDHSMNAILTRQNGKIHLSLKNGYHDEFIFLESFSGGKSYYSTKVDGRLLKEITVQKSLFYLENTINNQVITIGYMCI